MNKNFFEGSTGIWSPVETGFIVQKTRWSQFWNSFDVKIIFSLACIQIALNVLYGIFKIRKHLRNDKNKESSTESLLQEEKIFNPLDMIVCVFACLTGKFYNYKNFYLH